MNSLLVAWKPIILVMVLVLGGLWFTGHHGLAAFAAGGFFVLMLLLLTGNLPLAGLVTVVVATVIVLNFTGHIHYDKDRPYCFGGYHADGDWADVWAVGQLEFRIRRWHCTSGDLFAPGTYQKF